MQHKNICTYVAYAYLLPVSNINQIHVMQTKQWKNISFESEALVNEFFAEHDPEKFTTALGTQWKKN